MHEIEGKDNKAKFKSLMEQILKVLQDIKDFDKYYDKNVKSQIASLMLDYEDNLIVSSNQKTLFFMVEVLDDLTQLYDDMIFHIESHTYDERLKKTVEFLSDFNHKSYQKNRKFYEDTDDTLTNRIRQVSKTIHYKVGKLESTLNDLSKHVQLLESQNIDYAKTLKKVKKGTHQYSETAAKLTDNHKQIDYQTGVIKLTRKTKNSYELIANMFDQLAMFEEYQKNLKNDGYIRRLIRKLYRHPEQLDLMDNTADLADILTRIKDEINTIESIASPAQKMVFGETSDNIDDDAVATYMDLAEKE
jgi:exonuclease VII small subunit